MEEKQPGSEPDILDHYRPLAIRAVAAACVIRPPTPPSPPVGEPDDLPRDLPPGFHMPLSVWDD